MPSMQSWRKIYPLMSMILLAIGCAPGFESQAASPSMAKEFRESQGLKWRSNRDCIFGI